MKRHVLTALLLCLALCLPALAMAEGAAKPKLDVVWLIDVTGSIDGKIPTIKDQMDDFAAQLTDCDVRYSLVAYGDEANDRRESGYDFPEETVWLEMGSSHWTDSCETLKNYIEQSEGKLPKYLGGDEYETPTNAIVKAAEWIGAREGSETWRDGALRQFVLVTDQVPKPSGDYKVQGESYVYSMKEAIDACKDRKISVSVASFNDSSSVKNAYKDLVEQTNGKYQYVGGSTTIASSIGEWIHDTPVVVTQPDDLFVHDGDVITLNAVTLGGKETWFTWYRVRKGKEDGLFHYFTSDGIAWYYFRADWLDDDTEYYCRFTNKAEGDTRSIETRRAKLRVASKFYIESEPQNVTTDAGQDAEFIVVAKGDSLTYQWQEEVNGDWKPISGETGATLTLVGVTVDKHNGSRYRCEIKDAISDKQPGGYTLTSDEVTLTVYPAPSISASPKDVFTEAGKGAQFSVQVPDGMTLQWQEKVNGVWKEIAGETGDTLTVTASPENNGRQYRCVVKNRRGTEATSQPATLTVADAPAISASPQDVFTEAGKDAVFSAAATGEGMTYQWQEEVNGIWTPIAGETGDTLTVTATPEKNGRRYRCVATSSFGTETTSQPATLTVADAPAITAQPQSLRAEVGEGAEFTVEATGYELRYQWQVLADGVWTDCPNGRAKTLTLSALKRTDDGSVYRCRVTSGFGTELISDEVTLTVVALPDLPETGDSSRLWLWAALCAACMLGIAALKRRA